MTYTPARPCLDCGTPTRSGSRCDDCQTTHNRAHEQTRPGKTARGYDGNWKRLSARARRLQPFCSNCGTTENLTCDHTPEAWRRRARGQVIRIQDVDVLCMDCNIAAGAARGKNVTRTK